jgi:putative two-component system response regulator
VGKIGIPDRILLKPGSLSANEWAVMRTHPEIGCSLLRDSGAELLDAAVIALTHHERMDGTGYPYRLSAEQIPLEGRIAAVADVFDALTSNRVYRPALPSDEALAAMRAGRGTQFDAGLLDLFLDAADDVVAIVEAPSPPAQALVLTPAP